MVVVPTIYGWLLFLVVAGAPVFFWMFCGESFLSVTDRVPARILIVEAWMHEDGANAAAAEFRSATSHYDYIVATGGLTGEKWYRERWKEVDIVGKELERLRIDHHLFIPAYAPDVDSQRTYLNAITARDALARRGIHPDAIDVLTRGVHARRSRLEFQKAFGPNTTVGIIGWIPPGYDSGHWWQSSERAIDFIKESAGYVYETVLSSGRIWHTPPATIANSESPYPTH